MPVYPPIIIMILGMPKEDFCVFILLKKNSKLMMKTVLEKSNVTKFRKKNSADNKKCARPYENYQVAYIFYISKKKISN